MKRLKLSCIVLGAIAVCVALRTLKNSKVADPKECQSAFYDVLFCKSAFTQVYPQMSHDMTLDEIYDEGKETEMREENRKFTLLDLDGDRIYEIILPLVKGDSDYIYAFEILHFSDGDVLGYALPFRGFYPLKEDGTFLSSGGATDWRICSIYEFTEQTYYENTHMQIASFKSYGGNMDCLYYIDGQEVDKRAFEEASDDWNKKADVPFFKLSKLYWYLLK